MAQKKATTKKKNELKNDLVADMKELQSVTKDAVDSFTETAKDMHLSLAKMPMKYFEKIEMLVKPVKHIKEIQEKTIEHTYSVIQDITSKVDDISKDILLRV